MNSKNFILGAGMTGLAAGHASGLDVYEARHSPGGICSSYYLRPDSTEHLASAPTDGEVYRFEIGGGHWIFGDDRRALNLIESLVPVRRYTRNSGVYFPADGRLVPYPLQNHLRCLPATTAAKALAEMTKPAGPFVTMHDWLAVNFGSTLCRLFFWPFHQLYTAGLADRIAPQDAFKSPLDLAQIRAGACSDVQPAGYNATFVYPSHGLDHLARKLAADCRVHYGKGVTAIDPAARTVVFSDGSRRPYHRLATTLPLNQMMQMTGLETGVDPDPFTSVLVVNIGARIGKKCPKAHWLYIPTCKSGFHRVGFYSNVDASFLPLSSRQAEDRVAIYVEKAFVGGEKPPKAEMARQVQAIVDELQRFGFIGTPEVVDPTWIEVAYTWSWPGSKWKDQSMGILRQAGIEPIGRYGQWNFQGIAASISDGLRAGAALKADDHG